MFLTVHHSVLVVILTLLKGNYRKVRDQLILEMHSRKLRSKRHKLQPVNSNKTEGNNFHKQSGQTTELVGQRGLEIITNLEDIENFARKGLEQPDLTSPGDWGI